MNRKKMIKGSFTIEAAIIMPIIIIITVMLIYLSFYLYNACLLSQTSYQSALRGSLREGEGTEMEQCMQEAQKEISNKRLPALSEICFTNEVKGKEVSVDIYAGIHFPLFHKSDGSVKNAVRGFTVRHRAEKVDAISFIRACRKIEGIGADRKDE